VINDADVSFGDSQQRGDRRARAKGPLATRPDHGLVAAHVGHGARRSDHSVHLKRPAEDRFVLFFCFAERAGRIAPLDAFQGRETLRRRQVGIQLFPVRGQFGGRLRPGHFQRPRRLDRGPFGLGHDADKIPLAHDLHETGNILDRIFVDRRRRGVDHRRPYDPPMKHSRNPNVMNVNRLAGHLGRQIEARHGLPDGFVILRVFGFDVLGQFEIAGAAFGVNRDVEALAADELRVGDLLR